MMLHAKYISDKERAHIISKSPDTDIFSIGIGASARLGNCTLYFYQCILWMRETQRIDIDMKISLVYRGTSDDLFFVLEEFVCRLSGMSDINRVDEARYSLFSTATKLRCPEEAYTTLQLPSCHLETVL